MMASAWTLETTWQLQIQHPDGSWNHYSQGEYTEKADVEKLGREIYGGECTVRYIKIDRTIIEA